MNMTEQTITLMEERGLDLQGLAELILWLQQPYFPELQLEECLAAVRQVVSKREVRHLIWTGLALDMACEAGNLPDPLASVIKQDAGLYGVDETIGMGIASLYGSIAVSNFGYLDKMKKGIVGRLNDAPNVGTFADDIAAAIIACGAARIAHHQGEEQE